MRFGEYYIGASIAFAYMKIISLLQKLHEFSWMLPLVGSKPSVATDKLQSQIDFKEGKLLKLLRTIEFNFNFTTSCIKLSVISI